MHVENLVVLVCVTLLLSFISSLIYRYTKIPDIIWLIGFGLLMGSGTQYVDKALFTELAPLMSIIALSIILFEAGINVDILTLIEHMGKAAVLSVSSILLSTIIIGLLMNYVMPNSFTLMEGMLLGAMLGGTDVMSVFGVLGSLDKAIPNLSGTKVLLTMESVISDPICIITSITLIRMILQPGVSIRDGLGDIVSIFILSSILGVLSGLAWSNVLNRLRAYPYTYMITLAVLLPLYILGENVVGEGAGSMTALAFGIGITNYSFFMERLGRPGKVRINVRRLRDFHEEIVFFIKSFFFVYIGAIVTVTWGFVFVGFLLAVLLVVLRYFVVSVVGGSLLFSREESAVSKFVFVPGLAAFVISQLPSLYDPGGSVFLSPGLFPNICMLSVLGLILYSGLLGPWLIRREFGVSGSRGKPSEDKVEGES